MDNDDVPPVPDTRDVRTQEGELPKGDVRGPEMVSSLADEAAPHGFPDDPVDAVNPQAKPSDYTMSDIARGRTPLGEGMDMMIDPSIGRERLSTNPDVLDLDDGSLEEGEEPDFMQDPGTTDIIEVIEGDETYFAPVDPPSRATRSGFETVEVLDGFSATSFEEPTEPEDHPVRLQFNDDELEEQVRYALATDSYTADLNIEVEVENRVVYLHGKVRSLDDIEQAEQLAGSVPGVEDVEEDLEIV